MIQSIVVGALLTFATVGIHVLGTAWWIDRLKKFSLASSSSGWRAVKILGATALLLLGLHIVEVSMWAVTYLLLPNLDSLNTLEEAIYFSMVTFASLGYGDIVIQGSWRLLSAIEAMNGLLIFGWSTALLFAVVQRIWAMDMQQS